MTACISPDLGILTDSQQAACCSVLMTAPYTVCELLKKARSIYACIQVLAAHGVTLPPPAPPAAAPAAAAVPEAAAAPAAQPAEGAAAAATPSEGKLKPVPLHDMPALQKRKCLSIIKAMCCAGYNDHNTHTPSSNKSRNVLLTQLGCCFQACLISL